MFEQCKSEFTGMMSRVEQTITDKWPETLSGDGGVWLWMDNHSPTMRKRMYDLNQRLNSAWLNGMLAEVKKLSLEWGRLQLEIFKGYSLYLKETSH